MSRPTDGSAPERDPLDDGLPTLAIGEIFAGRYRIEALIGRGGMGAVYRAWDERVGDRVALKTLAHIGHFNEEALERFRREVRLARRITHPNIARIHDLGSDGTTWFLTMELVEGRDLATLIAIEGPRFPEERAAAIMLPVVLGLSAAHDAGVVHRDLKPGNVLVDVNGRVVLTDFGIARTVAEDPGARFRTAGPIGTPIYMAPEQVTGAAVDARTDLYAAGLMLFEMLTGTVPFMESTALATAVARLQRPPPDPRQYAPVSDELATLVLACLSRDPAARPSKALEIAEVLRPFAARSKPPPAGPPQMADTVLAPSVPPSISQTGSRAKIPETMAPGSRTLAVLPFRYHGPPEHDYLGEGLSDELIDVLSRTRGLRVLASGATRAHADRDPRTLGRELDADVMVDGTVQASGPRVRIAARLWDVRSGLQIWSDRFDGSLEDVFDLQDKMSQRIAEALRVGLNTATYRGDAPPEAVEDYLRARRLLHAEDGRVFNLVEAIELLESCLAKAPSFAPAMSLHARACLWAWFLPGIGGGRDWEEESRKSVARALDLAPNLAETHNAAAVLAVQDGHYAQAARSLERALEIAPTFADAHEYLGRLMCEAGRADQGIRHLKLAVELDPTLFIAHSDMSRYHALRGDFDKARAEIEVMMKALGDPHPAVLSMRVRLAAWSGDHATLRESLARFESAKAAPFRLLALYATCALGNVSPEVEAQVEAIKTSVLNPRFRTFAQQLGTEASTMLGRYDEAVDFLQRAADGLLVDVEWLDRCPVIAPLRERPEWPAIRQKVRRRAESVWLG